MTEKVFLALDTETTGFDYKRESVITQIAAVAVGWESKRFLSQGTMQVKLTSEEIQLFAKEAMDVQAWTPEINETGIPLADCVAQFKAWAAPWDSYGFVAHCARFDRTFVLKHSFADVQVPWYCTKQGMLMLEKSKGFTFPDHKLCTLAAACGYKPEKEHQALEDVLACANGFLWLCSQGVSPEQMRIN